MFSQHEDERTMLTEHKISQLSPRQESSCFPSASNHESRRKINNSADDISPRQKHLPMISICQHAESKNLQIAGTRSASYCQYVVYLAELENHKHYWIHEIQNVKRMQVEKVVILDQK